MFKKSQRYSFKRGVPAKNLNTEFFGLRYQKTQDNKFSCAFVVSKKIDKRAIIRHKLKRRYSDALREIIKNKNVPYGLVFFIKKSSLEKEIEEIKQEITKAFNKLNII